MHYLNKMALSCCFALSPLSVALAAEPSFQLPTINVVANLVAQDNADTLAAVTVMNREEI